MKNSKVIQRIKTQDVLKAIEDGDVSVQVYPIWGLAIWGLAILNYTSQAQYSQHWTDTVRACRGLVVKWDIFSDWMDVIIEPPQKFFNHNEPNAPDISGWMPEELLCSEKLDGYFISVRNDSKYGMIVTSRGSFTSRYAEAAFALLPSNIPKDIDYFCELLQDFPGDEDTIVARHPEPKLVCWGVNQNGHQEVPTLYNKFGWPGEIAQQIGEQELRKYLEQDVEGVVVYNTVTQERVKVKTEWYLNMHRAISHCTFKHTLEIVAGGGQLVENNTGKTTYTDNAGVEQTLNINTLPEEHLAKMLEWELQIHDAFETVCRMVADDWSQYKDKTPKEYALESKSEPYIKSLVFQRFKTDPSEMDPYVWKVVKKQLLLRKTDDK